MKPERPDAEVIFGNALRLSKLAEREAYLARACAGNAQLLNEVKSLLSAHHRAGDFLGRIQPLSAPDLPVDRPRRGRQFRPLK